MIEHILCSIKYILSKWKISKRELLMENLRVKE